MVYNPPKEKTPMEHPKYPHDPSKYTQLLALSKEAFKEKDADSLELLRAQVVSLHKEGYVSKTEKRDISRLIVAFLDILAHPFNH